MNCATYIINYLDDDDDICNALQTKHIRIYKFYCANIIIYKKKKFKEK